MQIANHFRLHTGSVQPNGLPASHIAPTLGYGDPYAVGDSDPHCYLVPTHTDQDTCASS